MKLLEPKTTVQEFPYHVNEKASKLHEEDRGGQFN